jgi:predicted metal-dependent hydrolase
VVPAIVGIPALVPGLMLLTSYVMMVDPDLRRPVSVRRYLQAVRARRAPNLGTVIAQLPVYLRPGHHPDHVAQHDAAAQAYLAELRS